MKWGNMLTFIKGLLGMRTIKSPSDNERVSEGWKSDIEFLKLELAKRHKNLFYSLDEQVYFKSMDLIKASATAKSREKLIVELMACVARVNDGHTKVLVNHTAQYPFEFYYFEEGIFVTKATEQYVELVGMKLTHINTVAIEEVLEIIQPLVSCDNEQQLKSGVVKYLVVPEILKGTSIIFEDRASFSFESNEGNTVSKLVYPIDKTQIQLASSYVMQLPFGRQHLQRCYWSTYFTDKNTLYFQYNACRNDPNKTFREFNRELFELIDQNQVDQLIIDLRFNGGGNSMILSPFLKALKKRPKFKSNVIVLIGRSTFSSALLNAIKLKKKFNVTLVGEPTGGKPNHFGELMFIQLTNLDIEVMYSTQYYKNYSQEMAALFPQIKVPERAEDYFKGFDRALSEMLNMVVE